VIITAVSESQNHRRGAAVNDVRLQIELRAALNILEALGGDTPSDALNGLLNKSLRTNMMRG
jgi:hypothetical protein